MTKTQRPREERSLQEVRQWKAQSSQESHSLSAEEYLERLRGIVQNIMAEYHLTLTIVSRQTK